MDKTITKYGTIALSVLISIGVFLFWYIAYPHAMSYQEQYQLFLWTSDYFVDRLSVPGGFASWIGEFIVQFYYIEWLGALLLSLLFVALGCTTGWIPAALVLWLLGDPSVKLGYVVALLLAVDAHRLNSVKWGKQAWCEAALIPIIYWLTGPLAWVYVLLRMHRYGWKSWPMPLYLLALQLLAYRFCLTQWTLEMTMMPAQYYRTPMMMPVMMWLTPLITVFTMVVQRRCLSAKWLLPVQAAVFIALCFLGISKGYDKEMYELIRQDYLVRQERWDEIVTRAKEYQVKTAFSSVCVNLALSQKHQLADRMFDFYQSDENALIMPRIRDLTSMLPSAETFWRLGMVNSALRYFFDTQESILDGSMSGRCTKRIAECMIVNGHYKTARKHLDLLKKSLFYHDWAVNAEALLGDEAAINAHPVYGKLRQLRYKNDFLYSHLELYKMFGLLFMNNTQNTMALEYFMGQMLLEGQMQGFQQYMPMAEKYSGYREMPIGYQDAMMCIQKQGNVPGSPYAAYVKRMMAQKTKNEDNDEAH
ncbi:MAG: hypothetical protein E7101_14260 [Prevotella ruminicola]|uniref:Transmembrane protein n=1 Tax=Xylanibacter ruminicola TaxID=839 RepID=A0A9D5S8P3_XYLRU|nr:hypothetical protein [Xylanibacter ruminicola]